MATTSTAASHIVRPAASVVRPSVPVPTTVKSRKVSAPAPVRVASSSHPTVARLADPPVSATVAGPDGYSLIGRQGGIYKFPAGSATSMRKGPSSPIVAAVTAPKGGYRLVASDGSVYASGWSPFYGSASGYKVGGAIVAAAEDVRSGGYWLAGANGTVFGFYAPYKGSAAHLHLKSPIVAMAATPSGQGYWLFSRDGGVFAFGDAHYFGSAGSSRSPIVGAASTTGRQGYWLVASDGSVYSFGAAHYYGNATHVGRKAPVAGITAPSTNDGYWIVSSAGGVYAFGSAPYLGSAKPPYVAPRVVRRAAPKTPRAATVHLVNRGSILDRSVAADGLAGPYPTAYLPGSTGLDIAQYQCGDIPKTRPRIAVVQVTDGTINGGPNPCYLAEARWAGPNMSAYIFMDGLPNPAPAESMSGQAGNCRPAEGGCQAYNFGWNWSRRWVQYSRSVGINPRLWWLDVENTGGWGSVTINDLTIQGAVAGLRSEGATVGFYSTPGQWAGIAGSLTFPGAQVWSAGAGNLSGPGYTATQFCTSGNEGFAGGHLALVQWSYTGSFPGAYSGPATPYDHDYACPR